MESESVKSDKCEGESTFELQMSRWKAASVKWKFEKWQMWVRQYNYRMLQAAANVKRRSNLTSTLLLYIWNQVEARFNSSEIGDEKWQSTKWENESVKSDKWYMRE